MQKQRMPQLRLLPEKTFETTFLGRFKFIGIFIGAFSGTIGFLVVVADI